jgi:hypothetical protein
MLASIEIYANPDYEPKIQSQGNSSALFVLDCPVLRVFCGEFKIKKDPFCFPPFRRRSVATTDKGIGKQKGLEIT